MHWFPLPEYRQGTAGLKTASLLDIFYICEKFLCD